MFLLCCPSPLEFSCTQQRVLARHGAVMSVLRRLSHQQEAKSSCWSDWFAWNVTDISFVQSASKYFFVGEGGAFYKRFWWTLSQEDTWNKSNGYEKSSIWHARLHQLRHSFNTAARLLLKFPQEQEQGMRNYPAMALWSRLIAYACGYISVGANLQITPPKRIPNVLS